MRFNSIRARMTGSFVLTLAPFLLLVCLLVVVIGSHLNAIQSRLVARDTATHAKKVMASANWQPQLDRLMAKHAVRDHQIGLIVVNAQKQPIWRSNDELPVPPSTLGDRWQIIVRKDGSLTLYVFYPSPGPLLREDRETSEMLLLAIFVLLATGAGSWALVGYTLRPIHALSQQAATASATSPDVLLVAPSPDAEIVELVGTLNGLLARQAQSAVAKGRFYAAASHELRTPLQALSGHLELALSRERAAEEYKTALVESLEQTQRLTTLVRALLLLHQIEGDSHLPQEPVEIGEICRNVLEPLAEKAAERKLQITLIAAENTTVDAVPAHAQILVRNLLENAVRYARMGGQVEIAVELQRDGLHLRVYNDSPTGEDDDPQLWLEPFHRPDLARTASSGGNGLGLAICRAVADSNGWKIRMERKRNGIQADVVFAGAHGITRQ